jgi:hypothetical protein
MLDYKSPYDDLPVMAWLLKASLTILSLGTSLWFTCLLLHIGHYTWVDCTELAVTLYGLLLTLRFLTRK